MAAFGLALLIVVGVALVTTGLPVFAVLLGAALVGALVGVAGGTIPPTLVNALPGRLIALFEHDLLQALPLYVLMGVLLERMGIAAALFRVLAWVLPGGRAKPLLAGLGLGALLGPMNGSVGASVLAISRAVSPSLARAGVAPAMQQAITAVAGTLGAVIPPSLVLILLGDAMLTAHTIAINGSGRADRVINTQDVLRGALVPAAILLAMMMLTAILVSWRNSTPAAASLEPAMRTERPPIKDILIAAVSVVMLLVLLGGVALGRFYAVEAAATGAFVLFAAGLVSRRIRFRDLDAMLSEVLVTTGALFAPLLAATTFTLILRLLGTDKLISGWVTALPGGEVTGMVIVLGSIGLAAFVLDAFEIIFVVVPILIPPLLLRVPDAVWVSVLVLLTLQASFLLPPVGYALMMTRTVMGGAGGQGPATPLWPVIRALAPFLVAQVMVLGLVVAFPALVHVGEAAGARTRASPTTSLTPEETARRMRQLAPPPGAGLPPFGAPLPPIGAPK